MPQFKVGIISLLLLAILIFQGGNLLYLCMILAALIIHELSHFFCCSLFDYRVTELRLTPFGGSLMIDPLFEINPVAESFIAAAGPLSNLLMVGGVFYLKLLGLSNIYLSAWQNINLLIGAINLIPALPLDGGHILHSWLNKNLGFEAAILPVKVISAIIAVLVLIFGAVKFMHGEGGVIFIAAGSFILFHIVDLRKGHLDLLWQLLQRKKRLLSRKGILSLKPVMVTPQTPLRVPLQKYKTNDYLLFFIFNDENHFMVMGEESVWKLLIIHGFNTTFREIMK